MKNNADFFRKYIMKKDVNSRWCTDVHLAVSVCMRHEMNGMLANIRVGEESENAKIDGKL